MKALSTLVVDVVAIVVFAILGRSSHAEGNTFVGVLGTAWPFLAAAVLGHVVCQLIPALRRVPSDWRSGVVVWAVTVVAGLILRVLSGDTAALPFILVASLVLAVFLIGRRALYDLIQRTRRTRTA
ncbi:MAG: DUF3054 domain-containing protein [Microlunatus sp.]|nr:DUF3054 domain-containing protein [Microlunatus sp.]